MTLRLLSIALAGAFCVYMADYAPVPEQPQHLYFRIINH